MVIKNNIATNSPSLLEKLTFFDENGYYINEEEIKKDVIRIRRFYERRGFVDAAVDYRYETLNRDWKKKLVFEVIENAPIRIDSVRINLKATPADSNVINDNDNFQKTLRRIPFREGQRYQPIIIPNVEADLTLALKNIGYAYAQTDIIAQVDTLSRSARILLNIESGSRARFDSVLVKGEEHLHRKYIVRETGIEKGELFSEDQLKQTQREVFNHHMLRFAIVSVPEQEQDSTLNVLIRVKESPLRSVQLELGAGFELGAGNPVRIDSFREIYKIFRTQATWIHRNVRGRGERFSTSLRVSGIEQSISADYLFPYVYNTKSSVVISPFAEHKLEKAYEIVRGGINNSFIYKYNQRLTGTLSYEFSLNNEMNRNNNTQLPDSLLSYNVSSFSANAYYASGVRQGRNGWLIQPYWELSGLFGEATFSFQKLNLDIRKYTPVSRSVVWANRINTGIIYYSKQDSLPSDIRLYNGGTNSVRGWGRLSLGPKRPVFQEDEDGNTVFDQYVPVGGKATFNFSTELRIQLDGLIKGFGVATFLDGGQVWRTVGAISPGDIQFGVGGGLRYQSPIGPVRVDVGYKVNPTRQDLGKYQNTDDGRRWPRLALHFSIGQAF